MIANENNKAGLTADDIRDQIATISKALDDAISTSPVDMAMVKHLTETRNQALKMLNAAVKAEVSDVTEEETEAACEAIKADLREWLKRRDYSYVLASDRFWLSKADCTWIATTERAIKNDRPTLRDGLEWKLFLDVLKEDGRHFDRQTYTFNKVGGDTLNMLRLDFCQPVVDGQAPHWFFDRIIASIAGEKPDNIAHIERLIVAKYLHPENLMIPALVLQDEGGTGKSLFVTRVLGAIFGTHAIADNLAIEEVCGKFNAKLAGRAVWFINETARGKYNLDDLKRKVGSATYSVEPKGVDSFEADMTAWVIVSGNDEAGSIKLSGNGVDRRWSIVKGGRSLKEIVAETMKVSVGEAKTWIEAEGQHIVSDRAEAGRWLATLIDRHGDVDVIDGHHGEDYHAVAETQKSVEHLLFDAVFLDPRFEHIKRSTLYDLYCHYAGGGFKLARGTLYAKLDSWAKKNKLDITMRRCKVGSGQSVSKLDFFAKDSLATRVSADNDEFYIKQDDYGRVIWRLDIG
jgi:hypothetical protein